MVTVSIAQAKAHLSSLVAAVERRHDTVLICRHGQAVAEIIPVTKRSRLKLDPVLKKVVIKEHPLTPTECEWENV